MRTMDEAGMAELEKLADSLGNVLLACRQMGVSRSLYYKWRRLRARAEPRRHPQTTGVLLRKEILALAAQFPDWGCNRIAFYLQLRKEKISATTVQKILRSHGLGTQAERNRAGLSQTNAIPPR